MLPPMSETPKQPSREHDAPQTEGKPQVFEAATAMFAVPQQMAAPAPEQAPSDPQEAGAQAEAPQQMWHVVVGAAQEGPLSVESIAQRMAQGALQPGTLVWRAGMANWSPLQDVPELRALIQAAPDAARAASDASLQAPPPHQDAMGPAADAALQALMAQDAASMAASAPAPAAFEQPAPQASALPQSLAGQDLFGANETQFLQVPSAAGEATASDHGVSTAAAAPAHAAPSHHVAPARANRRLLIGAASLAIAAAAAAGAWFLRPTPSQIPAPAAVPVQAAPAAAVPVQVAPVPAAPSAAPSGATAPQQAAPAPLPAAAPPGPAVAAPKVEAEAPPTQRGTNRRQHGRSRGHTRRPHHRRGS